MNAAIRERRVGALRNDYVHGRAADYMRDVENGGLCPLGVLCDLFRKDTGVGEWRGGLFYVDVPDGKSDGPRPYATTLPKVVRLWAGLETSNPNIGKEGDEYHSVTYYHTRETFPQIAERIAASL